MKRDVLDKYVAQLAPDAQEMFRCAKNIWYAKADYDTLSEEFQLSCAVMSEFEKRAEAAQ